MTQARLIVAGLSLTVLAALLTGLLWFRGEAIKADARADQWEASAKTYAKANVTANRTIAGLQAAARANDAIEADLRRELDTIKARSVETRTVVREVYVNEPEARDWGSTAVPDSLRNAANASR